MWEQGDDVVLVRAAGGTTAEENVAICVLKIK